MEPNAAHLLAVSARPSAPDRRVSIITPVAKPDHTSPTQAPDDLPAPGSSSRLPAPDGIEPQIGPYRVLEKLGEGGFGIVYLADQREPVRRRVALKVLKAGMDSQEILARFETERQALALMDHPGIARILDAGMTPRGRPFFAMEHVHGVPITDYCDTNRLDTRARLALFTDACRAVQHAHQRGIIHRDLKPSNVLVALVDGGPVVKVIDFGIAKALTPGLTGSTVHTRAGLLIGTPEYMSPEQAATGGNDIDTRTDVYSLGVILYELLTGLLPFDPGQFREGAFAEMQRIIREVDPPSPSTRLAAFNRPGVGLDIARKHRTTSDGLRRQVRGELDWITMRALEKDRTRRYESPSSFAADIDRHLNEEPVLAGPPSAAYRARKFVRKHRLAVGVTAAFVLLLAGGLVTTTILFRRAERQRDLAEDARAAASGEAAKAVASLNFLFGMFRSIDPNSAQGREVTVREVLDDAASRVGGDLREHPTVEASVREILGEAYHALGKPSDAEREFRRSLELRDSGAAPDPRESLQTAHNLGAALLAAGKYPEALGTLTRAADGRSALLGEANADTLASLSLLAFAQMRNDDYRAAEATTLRALAGQERLLGPGARDTVDTRNSLADLFNQLGRFEAAAAIAEENARIATQFLGDTDTKTLEALGIRAAALQGLGDLDGAGSVARSVAGTKARILGPDHPDTLLSLSVLAAILSDQGNYAECEQIRAQCAERSAAVLGPEHPSTLSYRNNLAQILHVTGRLDEAEQIYRSVLDARRRIAGLESLDTLISLTNLGLVLNDKRKPEEAQPYLAASLEGLRVSLPPDHWMIGAACGYLAECQSALGRNDQAERLFAEGHGILERSLGARSDRARKHAAAFAAHYERTGAIDNASLWRLRSVAP